MIEIIVCSIIMLTICTFILFFKVDSLKKEAHELLRLHVRHHEWLVKLEKINIEEGREKTPNDRLHDGFVCGVDVEQGLSAAWKKENDCDLKVGDGVKVEFYGQIVALRNNDPEVQVTFHNSNKGSYSSDYFQFWAAKKLVKKLGD